MKTVQSLSTVPPREENRNIGIQIYCPHCEMGRVFKIDENLKLLQERTASVFGIRTICEGCKKEFQVSLGWIDARKQGYSYRYFPLEVAEEMQKVMDESELGKMHL